MKTKTIRNSKIGLLILSINLFSLFFFMSASLNAQRTNYSGTWIFNESKSQLGEMRFRAPASKLVMTQEENSLVLERTAKGRNGEEFTLKEKYTLDGKICENTGAMNTVKKSTITWSSDNKILTINSTAVFERDGNSMEIKTIEVFNLSNDGKVLTVNSTSTSQRGERKQTLVYDKTN